MLAAVLENELSNLLQIVNPFPTYFWIYPPQLKGDLIKSLNRVVNAQQYFAVI